MLRIVVSTETKVTEGVQNETLDLQTDNHQKKHKLLKKCETQEYASPSLKMTPTLAKSSSETELKSFFELHPIEKKVGRGSFGDVYSIDGSQAAVKVISRRQDRTESNIHKRLCHPNIVGLHQVQEEGEKVYLVMDYL